MPVGKIAAVDLLGERRIAVRWDDGVCGTIDLSGVIAQRTNLAPLRANEEFEGVQVSADGWSLEWPSGIDFGAPQLRRWAEEQAVRVKTDEVV